MRSSNSVGGFRIYPTSPEDAESAKNCIAIQGQFNDGMDRLNRERELTPRQHQLVGSLHPDALLAQQYRSLHRVSTQLWRMALEKQQSLNQGIVAGPYTTRELGQRLIDCADLWSRFKRELEG